MKHLGLLQKLILIFNVTIVIPFVFCFYWAYRMNYQTVQRELLALNQGLFSNGTYGLQQYIDSIMDVPLALYTDNKGEVLNALRGTEKYSDAQEVELSQYFKGTIAHNQSVLGISVVGNNNIIIKANGSEFNNLWREYEELQTIPQEDGFSLINENGEAILGCYCKTLLDYPEKSTLAKMAVYFELDELGGYLSSLVGVDEEAFFLLTVNESNVLWSSESFENVELSALNEEDIFSFSLKFVNQQYKFEITKFVPKYHSNGISLDILREILTLGIVLFIMTVLFAAYIYNDIIKPIRRISSGVDEIQEGIYVYRAESPSKDEIGILERKYERMVKRLNILVNKNMRNELEMTKAQLKLLQTQINPHFLNNMLQFISTEALLKGAENVSEALASLGRIFQYNMNIHDMEICFEEECRHIENYLSLQVGVHEGELIYRIDVADETVKRKVPRMILQPLVENSIKYNNWEKGCEIIIQSFMENGNFVILIMDNGPGFSKNKIIEIEEAYKSYQAKSSGTDGIGLLNVFLRLHIFTDGKFRWFIESGQYTVIRLEIPDVEEEDESTGR